MGMEDGDLLECGDGSPIDESWWSAILEEGERGQEASLRGKRSQQNHRGTCAGSPEDWIWARELYEADDTIELSVIGYNRGGVLVQAQSLRGFVPISHLLDVDQQMDEDSRLEQLASFVGQNLSLKVIEYDPERGRLVFSERAAQAGPGRRTELLSSLRPGQRVRGKVTNITSFGVFVDLGGVEGLIHVSELSWGRVAHPSDAVSCGGELEVQVLSVDREQGRVALSLRELLPDPWVTVEEHFRVGENVVGTVTNVVKFGAFVGIEDGLEGLIHISEFGDGTFLHPRNVLQEGEQVRVRIIHIDAEARRLGLSLRNVPQHGVDEAEDQGAEKGISEAREALSSS